ncbi:hypothetical protein LHP98_13410 [Rhodobacter sp. Har01]|uniref:hypothetical protein n=1 Tax=Rhodobacter sp. Har01 TaxID=2883999 RepID=UPI001D072337|nr:hypothetical protein [Rhodobacter sp. Har01]MCB6179117.1 hypothetical protein [Rhodobacter sp. Har01]
MTQRSGPADAYSPHCFLASLGAGGIAVTFLLWLHFWMPHPAHPVPVNEDILAAFRHGPPQMKGIIVFAAAAILVFALKHYRLLIWNLRQRSTFRRT